MLSPRLSRRAWIWRRRRFVRRMSSSALGAGGFGSLGLKAEDFGADTVVQLGRPPRRIDLLTALDGVVFDDCWRRREQVVLDGVPLAIIGRDDFIANKRAAGRLKDLADLESLNEPPSESTD